MPRGEDTSHDPRRQPLRPAGGMSFSTFKRIATSAGATVVDDKEGWLKAEHPSTGAWLQRDPKGYVSVHASTGSWSEGSNPVSTLTGIWKESREGSPPVIEEGMERQAWRNIDEPD